MKNFFIILSMLFSLSIFAGFEGMQDGTSLKLFNQLNCGSGLTCANVGGKFKMELDAILDMDLAGDGSDQLVGFLSNRVLATATTLTAAQCGSTIYNGGAIEIELPEASTVLGCRFTFVTLNAANFDVDPDAADQVLVQTDAAGDKIRNATLGNSITIEAVSASQWAVVGILGTWADAN